MSMHAVVLLLRSYWKPLLLVAAIMVGYFAIKLYGSMQYERGRDDCNREHLTAQLEAFAKEAERLTGVSEQLEQAADDLRNAKPKIIERQTRVEIQNPLPADCVIPADRLRISNDAIDAANAARKSEKAVPADRSPDQQ